MNSSAHEPYHRKTHDVVAGIWVAFFQRVPATIVRTGTSGRSSSCRTCSHGRRERRLATAGRRWEAMQRLRSRRSPKSQAPLRQCARRDARKDANKMAGRQSIGRIVVCADALRCLSSDPYSTACTYLPSVPPLRQGPDRLSLPRSAISVGEAARAVGTATPAQAPPARPAPAPGSGTAAACHTAPWASETQLMRSDVCKRPWPHRLM